MRLAPFFEAIAPYLEGRVGHDATVARLYGVARPGDARVARDAERLAIYERFVRLHRAEALTVFHHTRAVVERLHGGAGWLALVEDFFVAQPMRHFEINENGAALPAWLAEVAAARGLPAWLPELADLDWWSWRAEIGPDGEGDPAAGPLRIAPEVELRPYRHDLLAWLEAEPRPGAPAAAPALVIFWRDPDLDGRHAPVAGPRGAVELAVLKMVSEGLTPTALAAATGLPRSRIQETVDDLRAAGILHGSIDHQHQGG